MSDIFMPTIPNATVTVETLPSGNLRYTVTANEGYVLYSIAEYNALISMLENEELEGGIFDYLSFFRVMYKTASSNFADIGTMAEQPEMQIYGIVNPNPPVTE